VLFFGSRRFHATYGFFGPVVDALQCRRGGEWYDAHSGFVEISLTHLQDSIYLHSALLDGDRWPLDSVEDSQSKRRSLLGLANKACNHGRASFESSFCICVALTVSSRLPGTPLWMAFTYSKIPAMLAINRYFAPAGW
jgi:hypothetical protein